MKFNRYLTEKKQVDPAEYELVTIASCTGHSCAITREIPEGGSEDIDYLTIRSYGKYGSICHGTHVSNAQSILRNGLDVDYGVQTSNRTLEAQRDPLLRGYQPEAIEAPRAVLLQQLAIWD